MIVGETSEAGAAQGDGRSGSKTAKTEMFA